MRQLGVAVNALALMFLTSIHGHPVTVYVVAVVAGTALSQYDDGRKART